MQSTATFMGGPADGVTLNVDRTPIMLRVGNSGCVNRVLNNTQSPEVGETLHAYIMDRRPSTGFWDGRDPETGRRTGGQYSQATYRLCSLQPADWTGSWNDWCDENKTALMNEHNSYVAKG